MIRLPEKVPNNIVVACSGGQDSMVALDFFMRGRKNVKVAHFDHGTSHSQDAKDFVADFCNRKGLDLMIKSISSEKTPDLSPEEYWRINRLEWFHSMEESVVCAHHLDDAVEWWVFTSINGTSRVIPYRNKNIIRPLILTKKSFIEAWCKSKKIPFIQDPSNNDTRYSRNRIRNNIMPEILKVNPGIHKVVGRKINQLIDTEKGGIRPTC